MYNMITRNKRGRGNRMLSLSKFPISLSQRDLNTGGLVLKVGRVLRKVLRLVPNVERYELGRCRQG